MKTLLPLDVSLGQRLPSLRAVPAGRPNPSADDALDVAGVAGLELDGWQSDTLRDAMLLAPDGRWAAREVGVVVGRQNGKGSILEVRQLAGLFVLGERLQVHSAHEFKTCYEHFRRVKDLIEGCDLLADQVSIIRQGAGDQAIELRNGCRLRFVARSRSSGRGFTADAVYLDEAFKLEDATIGALLPTLSARPNSQVWYTSSAPHADSPVLRRVRERAVSGTDLRLFYAEWGNEQGCDPLDRDAWAKANPAMGIRIDVEDIAAEQRAMAPHEFARERLGIPDIDGTEAAEIPRWSELADRTSTVAANAAWSLAVSPLELGPQWASFGLAGRRADGRFHIEALDHRAGVWWVVDRAREVYAKRRLPLRVRATGAEGALIGRLLEAGVAVEQVSALDAAQACGAFIAAAGFDDDGTPLMHHLDDPDLNRAVNRARRRPSLNGSATWDELKSGADISPLIAVTVALGGVPSETRAPRIYSLTPKGR